MIFLNALNSTLSSLNSLVKLEIFIGFLRSGLSVPYLLIASAYVILGKGVSVTLKSEKVVNTECKIGSMALNTSSCSTNAISISN